MTTKELKFSGGRRVILKCWKERQRSGWVEAHGHTSCVRTTLLGFSNYPCCSQCGGGGNYDAHPQLRTTTWVNHHSEVMCYYLSGILEWKKIPRTTGLESTWHNIKRPRCLLHRGKNWKLVEQKKKHRQKRIWPRIKTNTKQTRECQYPRQSKKRSQENSRGRGVAAEEGENGDGTIMRKQGGSSNGKELKWQTPKRSWERESWERLGWIISQFNGDLGRVW